MRLLQEAAEFHAVEGAMYRHFPEQCARMGRVPFCRFLKSSRVRAAEFDFKQPQFQAFTALELAFGERYWEQREFRWARRILWDKDIDDPEERLKKLRSAAIFYVAELESRAPVVVVPEEPPVVVAEEVEEVEEEEEEETEEPVEETA